MKWFACILIQLTALTAVADSFRPDGRYDHSVPTPSKTLGFELGAKPASYDAIVKSFEAMAEASPFAELRVHGRTHEGRALVHLVISSQRTLARLDEIQANISQLADPRVEMSDDELDTLLNDTPAVAYMAYSIHGDELSGADAALRVAYELCAGRSADVEQLRDQLIVLVDPVENPDGRQRYLAMTSAFTGAVPNPDPESLNHTAFWPWGRTNHYLFDLNRDWFALVHPESRARANILRNWHPQLVVDSHEMGSQSTYLFNPPRAPYNPNLPSSTLDWWQRFSKDQASAFDKRGWSYYTRDWNEEFFPGYGSSLALYSGAMGILHEQASTDGSPVRKQHGGLLEYREAVEHQFVSSMANLKTAGAERRALLEKYRGARAEAIERGRKAPARAYYFSTSPDPARATRLASRLTALGIEVETLSEAGNLSAARTVWADGKNKVRLEAGSYRVRLDQPDGLLARAILEPHTPMTDSALAEEREHLERRKGSRIYDTTAWSPLLASGLDVWWSTKLDGLTWESVQEPTLSRSKGAGGPAKGGIAIGASGYGWLFDGTTDAALTLATRLASEGFKLRVGDKAFETNDITYPPGSYLIRREENSEPIEDRLQDLAEEAGVWVVPTPTARIMVGPDLGTDRWRLMYAPRIAIAAGYPLDYTSVGAAWHTLDKELSLRVSLIDVSDIDSIDLDRYNVVVLPHAWGGSSAYRRALGDAGIKALKRWVTSGGSLVAIGSASRFAADKDTELSAVRTRSAELEDFPATRLGLDDAAVLALERTQAMGLPEDGKATEQAGSFSKQAWPTELAIPGAGSPMLGPGTWAMLGDLGKQARKRFPLEALEPAKVEGSKEEKEKARRKIDSRLRRFLPSGAILRVDLDPQHWLSYGIGERVAAMISGGDMLLARDPVRTAGRFASPDWLHLGGLLWPEAAGRIAHTAYVTRESKARGQIILFSHDPNFRGYFSGTGRLFLNAVLLGPSKGAAHTIPW